jgi:hypothetical protein
MGFFFYRTTRTDQGVTQNERVGDNEVELAGRDGPIASLARSNASPERPTWHLPETGLLGHFSFQFPISNFQAQE